MTTDDRNIMSGRTDDEKLALMTAKAEELLKAIEDAGYYGFHISRSVTHFGVSVYIQGNYGLKFRLSDHSVTNTSRVLGEEHISLSTSPEYVVSVVRDAEESASERTRRFDELKRRYEVLDNKWERIRHLFDGLSFHRCERTYQTVEELIAKGRSQGKERTNIYVKELNPGYGRKAYYYEWTEPSVPNEYAVTKPSYEYIENFNAVEEKDKGNIGIVNEALKTLKETTGDEGRIVLYHGTTGIFDRFDMSFINSGWGRQDFGYGFYFTDSIEMARSYSRGGRVIRVSVPKGKYLTYRSASRQAKARITAEFFKYFTEVDEYGKEAYGSGEAKKCFWEDCQCIMGTYDGCSIYGTISSFMGDDKSAGEFLRKLGYVGLIYYDSKLKAKIYVLFDAGDIEIIGEVGNGSINESRYDVSEIGSVSVDDCDFDDESYGEWLSENSLKDTPINRVSYAKDNCYFTLEYCDSETYHHMDYEELSYDEMVDAFGQRVADALVLSWLKGDGEDVEPLLYTDDESVDTNDLKSIENDARLKLRHGEYFKGARGFILSNGEMVYTESEHNMITRVAGIGDKFEAIEKLGWIRVMPNSLDIGKKPTEEQEDVIWRMPEEYSGEKMYVDIMNDGTQKSLSHSETNPSRVLNDIRKAFSGYISENKTIKKKHRMKETLNEGFTLKNGIFRKNDGGELNIVYIDPASSESTFEFKKVIKDRFGAKWLGTMHTWGWFVSRNPEEVYRNQILPCLQYLNSVQKEGEPLSKNEIIEAVDGLIEQLKNAPETIDVANTSVGGNDRAMGRKELLDKVSAFKKELLSIVSSDDFKKKIEMLIEFSRAQGHRVSLHNTILIMIQDPDATFVKSRGFWLKANREVMEDAIPISLLGGQGTSHYTKDAKDMITSRFLASCNVKSKEELNVGDREKLDIALKGYGSVRFFSYVAYDIRFTRVIEGKEDKIPDTTKQLPWFTDDDETPESVKYVDIMLDVIDDHGVKTSESEKLGAARGVSKSGEIEYVKNEKKNIDKLRILVHEFAHELLHQRYLKTNNLALADMFTGLGKGRGFAEQQADLCSWTVLKFLGYHIEDNLNYVASWGLNETNVVTVFDSIAYVSSYIYKNIEERMGHAMNEALLRKSTITGLDIAELVGMGSLYRKSKEAENRESMEKINENFFKILNKIS